MIIPIPAAATCWGATTHCFSPRDEGPKPGEGIPAVALDNGLAAVFSRAAWYRLVDAAEQRDGLTGVESDGLFFPIADA